MAAAGRLTTEPTQPTGRPSRWPALAIAVLVLGTAVAYSQTGPGGATTPVVAAAGARDISAPGFWTLLWGYRWQFLRGTGLTIQLSLLSMALASTWGLALALARVYGGTLLSRAALLYVEFVRGTPLLVQLYFLYYGLPQIPGLGDFFKSVPTFWYGVLGIGMNYAAYEAEIYRAGLIAIPRGQTEAGLALGLSRAQVVRLVVLPQALRLVVPPVTNDFVALFKDTSIVSIIAIRELTSEFRSAATTNPAFYLGFSAVTALIYFLVSFPVSKMARMLEERIHPAHDHGSKPH